MYATERQREILDKARTEGRVEVRDLAESLAVTSETVRRDLSALERRGVLHRVHGGAIPVERLGIEPAVAEREARMSGQKERIAKAALDELPDDGGTIILDAGTTTIRLAELLPTDRELIVVTHSLPIAILLAGRPNITLHVAGGLVRGRTLATVGAWAERAMADVFADVAFLGTNGLTVEHGLTTPDIAEAGVKRALVAASRRAVLLADHTKIGRTEFARVAPLSAIDTVVTDSDLHVEVAEELEAAGTRVVRA